LNFQLSEAVAILERTPDVLDAWLRRLPDSWTQVNEGSQTWTSFDIVGHLIVGERTDWITRTRIILDEGESRTFYPFDMSAQFKESKAKQLSELLDEFAQLRKQNLETLREMRLTDADLARRGRHPELGSVTLEQLLATWVAHDLNHLHQLARVLATQYREATGAWVNYLGVMRCAGHSDK
jgi:uncharacterized damage-inducible protein DinB